MDSFLMLLMVFAGVLVVGLLALLAFRVMGGGDSKQLAELAGRLTQMAESSAAAQAQFAERLQAQERALSKTLEERLADVTRRIGDSLQKNTASTTENLSALNQRLAVIDAAQKNISELSGQVIGLQDILSNKQARGAFGEIQLNDLVRNALPPSAYDFQVTLGNGKRADCVLKFPGPPGSIAIDAKFPLESYRALVAAGDEAGRSQARRALGADVLKHVRDIADKYIVVGETAEMAMMFLPSEAIYAELHANLPDVVEKTYRARVWIVSPTTLMATLNTMRAILKDVQMREQAGVIQEEVLRLLQDVVRLDDRVGKLQRHFDQTTEDIRGIRISTEKVVNRAERIEELEIDENPKGANEAVDSDFPGAGAEIRRLEPKQG
jgi:DNA recombination protein RmuC